MKFIKGKSPLVAYDWPSVYNILFKILCSVQIIGEKIGALNEIDILLLQILFFINTIAK